MSLPAPKPNFFSWLAWLLDESGNFFIVLQLIIKIIKSLTKILKKYEKLGITGKSNF
jgi:hypothetical protein